MTKLADLKPGDRLTGFHHWGCVPVNAVRVVLSGEIPGQEWQGADLYVECRKGRHSLGGQVDDDGNLVNCRLVDQAEA